MTQTTWQSKRHEIATVGVLCLAWGIVSVEYLSVGFLAPFIEPALKLTNTQIGILVSAFRVPFCLSSFATGTICDQIGRRRRFLIAIMLAFSAAFSCVPR